MKKIILALCALCIIPLANANSVSVSNNTDQEYSFKINGVCLYHARVKPFEVKTWSHKDFADVCGENCEIVVYGKYCDEGEVLATIQSKNYATSIDIYQKSPTFGIGGSVVGKRTQFFFTQN